MRNWIPAELINGKNEWQCRWLYAGDLPFTDPFFDETLLKCRRLPINAGRYRPVGSIPSLIEWAAALPALAPSAFIFHISRCGSTLASQLLGLDPAHIVLAEVPFIDALLRLPYKAGNTGPGSIQADNPEAPRPVLPDIEGAVKAALRFYGQQRTGREHRLFVKADSWHIFFYRQLRLWYPGIPFILLYRSPDEVLYSHRRKRGMHAVPGLIEPAILGIDEPLSNAGDLDGHMAKVLERYLGQFLEIARTDGHAHLMNYSEGIPSIVEKIAFLTNITLSAEARDRMAHRSQYHAKYPGEVFSEAAAGVPPPPFLAGAMEAYRQLEKISVRLPHYAV